MPDTEQKQFIHELQLAAQSEFDSSDDATDLSSADCLSASRAAMLYQIDQFSRKAIYALSLVTISTIAIMAYAIYFVANDIGNISRILIWGGIVILSILRAAHITQKFRTGYGFGKGPFSWQRRYLNALAITGVCFAAGCVILGPDRFSPVDSLPIQIAFGSMGIIFMASQAHFQMAPLVLGGPSLLVALLQSLRAIVQLSSSLDYSGLLIWALAVAASCGVVIIIQFLRKRAETEALARRPRQVLRHIKARQKKPREGYNPYAIRKENTIIHDS